MPQVRQSVPGPKTVFSNAFIGRLSSSEWIQLHRQFKAIVGLPPDFLSSLLALVKFMRLSLLKAAHVDLFGASAENQF